MKKNKNFKQKQTNLKVALTVAQKVEKKAEMMVEKKDNRTAATTAAQMVDKMAAKKVLKQVAQMVELLKVRREMDYGIGESGNKESYKYCVEFTVVGVFLS